MTSHQDIVERLRLAGHELPRAMPAVATYVPAVSIIFGDGVLVHVAGQGPFRNGALEFVGCVGRDLDVEAACRSAELVCLNLIAQAAAAAEQQFGAPSLHRLRCLRLGIFLNCVDGFANFEPIADAASKIALAAFGGKGQHCRSVVGQPVLPMGTSVEIDGIFLLD